MELLNTVMDQKCNIIGFVVNGTEREFGGLSTNKVTRTVSIQEMMASKFQNGQVSFSNGKIIEKRSFKLKDLPAKQLNNNNELVDINNTIELKARLLVDGELRGFLVNIAGKEAKLKLEDIINLTRLWYKPVNYVLRHLADGKINIAGKAGMAIGNLPEQEMSVGKRHNKKAGVKTIQTSEQLENNVDNGFDLVSLYDTLAYLGGIVIKLPDTKYERTLAAETKTASDFIPLGVGEIASPHIIYGEKKLNTNTTFKKVGQVAVDIMGNRTNIPTFTYSDKVIFKNGENHLEKFGIAVKSEYVDVIKKKFGGSLAITDLTDENMLAPIRSLQGDKEKDLKFFTVDTSNLDVISVANAAKYKLSTKDIFNNVMRMEKAKVILKYAKDVIKNTRVAMSDAGIKDPRPKYGLFAGFNDEALEQIKEAGIDVFSGAFTATEPSTDKVEKQASDVRDMVSGTYEPDIAYEVIYAIKGVSAGSVKVADIRNKKDHTLLTPDVIKFVDYIEGLKSLNGILVAATEMKDKMDNEIYECRRMLWLHKVACFSETLKKGLKVDVPTDWEQVATRKKDTIEYACKVPGLEGLKMQLVGGIDIVK